MFADEFLPVYDLSARAHDAARDAAATLDAKIAEAAARRSPPIWARVPADDRSRGRTGSRRPGLSRRGGNCLDMPTWLTRSARRRRWPTRTVTQHGGRRAQRPVSPPKRGNCGPPEGELYARTAAAERAVAPGAPQHVAHDLRDKAIRRMRQRIRMLTGRNRRISMRSGSRRSTSKSLAGAPILRSPRLPHRSCGWTRGSGPACGRCAGRNGNFPKRESVPYGLWGSPLPKPTNGATAARATGGSQDPASSSTHSPTPTGLTLACAASPTTTTDSGIPDEPPDAGPHVRWCGRGRGDPGPLPDLRTAQFGSGWIGRT